MVYFTKIQCIIGENDVKENIGKQEYKPKNQCLKNSYLSFRWVKCNNHKS